MRFLAQLLALLDGGSIRSSLRAPLAFFYRLYL